MRMRRDEPCETITVTVTFLRMDNKPSTPVPEIPGATRTELVTAPTVLYK